MLFLGQLILFRSKKLEPATVERKNERGRDQELRERSKARMRKRNGKNFRHLRFFICFDL